MTIQPIVNGPIETVSYIVKEENTCLLIDAPAPAEGLIAKLEETSSKPDWIYLTHGHFDHVLALRGLLERYPDAKIAISEADKAYLEKGGERCRESLLSLGSSLLRVYRASDFDLPPIDRYINDGDELLLGFRAVSTPGHTKGSMCFVNDKERVLFSGDTLFHMGIGRTDLGGDDREMEESLEKIKDLEGDYMVLPGHGSRTTLSFERKNNPYLA